MSSWFGRYSLPGVVTVPPHRRDPFRRAFLQLWAVLAGESGSTPPIELTQALLAMLRLLFAEDLQERRAVEGKQYPDTDGRSTPLTGDRSRGRSEKDRPEEDRWARILAFIDAHYAEPITVQSLCRAVGVSRAELHRLCVLHTGHSAKRELTQRRMERAALLLRDGDRPVSRIAALTGYLEYQTFERQFRRFFGRTPGEFRTAGTTARGEGTD